MKTLLTTMLIISGYVHAQFYEIIYNVQPQIHFTEKALENLKQNYPDEKQRNEFLEMAKNITPFSYNFKYNQSESQTQFIQKIDNSQDDNFNPLAVTPEIGTKAIFHYNENLYYDESDMFKEKILVYDSLYKIDFVDTGKTKKILGFEVKEAIGKKGKYNVIAWYTPTIKYNYSPDKFYGTSGLILELHYKYMRDDIEIMISWNAINKKELRKIPKFALNTNLKKVSFSDYLKMIEESNQKQIENINQGVDKK